MIITARKEHISIIQKIAQLSWEAAYREILSSAQFDYMIEKFYSSEELIRNLEEQTFLLLEKDQDFLGFVAFQANYPEIGTWKIHKLYILPQTQGKGVGRDLINKVKDLADSSGASTLILNVNKYNKAKQFYEKMGFEVAYPEVIEIGEGYVMDDYVMELKLRA